ncbi:MAG: hypothetical protein MI924_29375, partial [Chloroflexales bacterium]|nr:hypothetical protein [Chloroflexales bacterium]
DEQAENQPDAAKQLEALHLKRQRGGLTASEKQTVAALVHHYEHAMLVRPQAAVLLKQRGYDVSDPQQFTPLA